jgi:hypothetical protein
MHTSITSNQSRKIAWQEWLSWFGIALAIGQMLASWAVVDLSSSRAYYVRLFYVLAELLAAAIFWSTGRRERRPGARIGWSMRALSLVVVAIVGADKVLVGLKFPFGGYVLAYGQWLYLAAYINSLLSIMIYFPKRTWLAGSTYRLIVDGAAVGFSTLVIMQTVLPLVYPWPVTDAVIDQMRYVAYEVVALFVFGVLYIRFGLRGGGSLCFAAVVAVLCLIAGDALYLVMIYYPGLSPALGFTTQPLYILHAMVLALGAHWSLTKPPRLPDASAIPSQPIFRERLAWKLPDIAVVGAVTCIALACKPSFLPSVLIFWALHGVVAAIEEWHVSRRLQEAQQQLGERRALTSLGVVRGELLERGQQSTD